MCGIAGVWHRGGGARAEELEELARAMVRALAHRGPDDEGVWVDPRARLALGHRRLAVIDLSPLGRQPMESADGRYIISYNGEIYNFPDLRRELEERGYPFRGRSDTEVMLAAFSAWGVEEALVRFNGMFAFALWDRKERALWLGRDRLGEKPLYYGFCGSVFLFASELKALRAHPGFRAEVDRKALMEYFRHNYIPAPRTIYRGVKKLPPGFWLRLGEGDPEPALRPYWSLEEAVMKGKLEPFSGPVEEAERELEGLLKDAVKRRMISDVPLGAFLSGGLDSSSVVALMQTQSSRPVRTFTIGFYEEDHDEARYARRVAEHLGTAHTELYLTPGEAMEVIPRLPEIYDEPFADVSQIPTFLVSRLARRRVTVVLSGDGGDELFGGYDRYRVAEAIWGRLSRIPSWARRMAGRGLELAPERALRLAASLARPLLGRGVKDPVPKARKLGRMLGLRRAEELYFRLISYWEEPEEVVRAEADGSPLFGAGALFPGGSGSGSGSTSGLPFLSRMMFLDTLTYLPDDILVKVDRASMAVSLEARIPLLDHRVVEFVWRLPLHMRVRNGTTKWLLRRLLYRHVPPELLERPKMGFGVPVGRWLRGPLREWAEELLAEERIGREGFLHPRPVRRIWEEHLSGKRDWQYHLWGVLMFQAWLERWG